MENFVLKCMQAVDGRYSHEAATRMGPDQEVVFEEEKITLNVPREGIALESGWKITPYIYPRVSMIC